MKKILLIDSNRAFIQDMEGRLILEEPEDYTMEFGSNPSDMGSLIGQYGPDEVLISGRTARNVAVDREDMEMYTVYARDAGELKDALARGFRCYRGCSTASQLLRSIEDGAYVYPESTENEESTGNAGNARREEKEMADSGNGRDVLNSFRKKYSDADTSGTDSRRGFPGEGNRDERNYGRNMRAEDDREEADDMARGHAGTEAGTEKYGDRAEWVNRDGSRVEIPENDGYGRNTGAADEGHGNRAGEPHRDRDGYGDRGRNENGRSTENREGYEEGRRNSRNEEHNGNYGENGVQDGRNEGMRGERDRRAYEGDGRREDREEYGSRGGRMQEERRDGGYREERYDERYDSRSDGRYDSRREDGYRSGRQDDWHENRDGRSGYSDGRADGYSGSQANGYINGRDDRYGNDYRGEDRSRHYDGPYDGRRDDRYDGRREDGYGNGSRRDDRDYRRMEPHAESYYDARPDDFERRADEQYTRDMGHWKKPAKAVAVYSAKGGVGKTTISCELASFLSLMENGRGKLKVCLADYNIDFGDVINQLDMDYNGMGMSDLAANIRARIHEGEDPDRISYTEEELGFYLQKAKNTGLSVLIAPISNGDSMIIKDTELEVIARNLIENGGFDFVVFDTGNNTRDSSFIPLELADQILMVVTQSNNSANCNLDFIATTAKAAKKIGFDMSKIALIINQVEAEKSVGLSVAELKEAFVNPETGKLYDCAAVIRSSSGVKLAGNKGIPLVTTDSSCEFTKNIGQVASGLITEEFVLAEPEEKKGGLFGKLFAKK